MKSTLQLLVALFFVSVTTHLQAQSGSLDAGFGINGVAIMDNSANTDESYAMAVQADGKIVLGGRSTDINSSSDIMITRFNADGSTDDNFGVNGKVIIGIGSQENIMAMAIQPDGKIIAGGYYIDNEGHYCVIRLNTDGSLDNGFGSNGIDTFEWTEGLMRALTLQSDGKILVGGSDFSTNSTHSHIMRLNANGSIDSTFGVNGRKVYELSYSADEIYNLLVQPDGKILACGYTRVLNPYYLSVTRINPDGSIDSTFSEDGIAWVEGNEFYGHAMVLQQDGKIITAGKGSDSSTIDALVVRFNTNGTIDSSFAANGKLLYAVSTQDDEVRGLGLDSEGKILVAGTTRVPSNNMNAFITRLNSNGLPDSTYGNYGTVISDLNNNYTSEVYAASLQSDDKLLVSGNYYNPTTFNRDFVVARFVSSCPAINNTVTVSGTTLTSNQAGATYQWLYCDSSYLPVASASTVTFTPPATGNFAVRIVADGCVDTSACENVSISGVEDIKSDFIRVLPSHFTDEIYISMNSYVSDYTVYVFSVDGMLVAEKQLFEANTTISLKQLPNALYLLRIGNNHEVFNFKLTK
ncbi:MAG TPA: hypothetical protein VK154_20650 [Chitinophagales bacterium]|nr:hypothetical protein [Chitinophagales bacterium]